MDYQSIDQIYEANGCIRESFLRTLDSLTEDEITGRPEGEKWSIEQIAEHVSIVEEGMSKICRKLLNEAKDSGLKTDGISISDKFREYVENLETMKFEAPERVQPTRGQHLADSRSKISDNDAWFETRPLFKEFDGTQAKFPHPYFGPLSAQEWLVLAGEHMRRHTGQIQKIVEKIRQ